MRKYPSFPEFYSAVHGRKPFPWQSRLAKQVQSTGIWPSEIGIPTGLGKTACLDIAIWWLASQIHLPPNERTAPTRIWWIVNRRLLVDSTHAYVEHIRDRITENTDNPALSQVASALYSIAGQNPLDIVVLRGGKTRSQRGIEKGRSQIPDKISCPSQPTVILSTLPMYGSRLLFRGYGCSRGHRPIAAAMAGTDSLVLLDESHLAPHLNSLVESVHELGQGAIGVMHEARECPVLVSLTATGDQTQEDRFLLDDDDRKHPTVHKRLNATKRMEVREMKKQTPLNMAKAVKALLDLTTTPSTCLVFCNTPEFAREVFDTVNEQLLEADVHLLTGRMRDHEAEETRNRILHPESGMLASAKSPPAREQHFIVVATQTLEVGADVDAEYLVTEQCGVRALTQRLGRLNRMGKFDHARAIYVHMKGERGVWPVYGTEPTIVLDRLKAHLDKKKTVDLSPGRIESILGLPQDQPGMAPKLPPEILSKWTQTQMPAKVPVEPYFNGMTEKLRDAHIIWRSHLPEPGEQLWPPVRQSEGIEIPVYKLWELYLRYSHADNKQKDFIRTDADGIVKPPYSIKKTRPGDQIILRSDLGFMDEFGWNPESKLPVKDLSILDYGIPLDKKAIWRICGKQVGQGMIQTLIGKTVDGAETISRKEQRDAVDLLLDQLSTAQPQTFTPEEWEGFIADLRNQPRVVANKDRQVPRIVSAEIREQDPESREKLTDHHCAVGKKTHQIAEKLLSDDTLVQLMEFCGQYHDIGKLDERFQRMLKGDSNSDPLANSPLRGRWIGSGWPRGGRHEALSARIIEKWLKKTDSLFRKENDDELKLHLILTHHGWGRPVIRPVKDHSGICRVQAKVKDPDTDKVTAVDVDARLDETDLHQPGRFQRMNELFGPWNLALLEAILRLADQQISEKNRS